MNKIQLFSKFIMKGFAMKINLLNKSAVLTIIFSVMFSSHSFATVIIGEDELLAKPERMENRILKLGTFGANPEGGVSRVAYSKADLDGRAYFMDLLRGIGLNPRIDEGGNIIARREGTDPSLPVIMFGSHIDSVPGGGNYDGNVGSVGALEAMELLIENDILTRHPLELVVFSNEEGGLYGSLAMIGKMTDKHLAGKSNSGLTIAEGIDAIGGDSKNVNNAHYTDPIEAFIELHIEQGGFLEKKGLQIGVVKGIVGIKWWDVEVLGMANHAGATPMPGRFDSLVSASKLVLDINDVALNMEGGQVATVGIINAEPGAPNVIPGRVTMSLEIRDLSMDKIDFVFGEIEKRAAIIAKADKVKINFTQLANVSVAAPTDIRLRKIIEDAATEFGLSSQRMPSGAGHDAQDMAKIAPTGMIFVPSKGGISHAPEEFTSAQDMANGATILVMSILKIDSEGLK